jgi:hypothetical protein
MSDTKDPGTAVVRQRTFSLMPSSLGEAREIALLIANSDFAPKDYKGKPDNVIVALQMGADLGLKPMQALQNIAVINGRPSIYGDAALALVMPVLERFYEGFEGVKGSDTYTAVCIAKRKGWPDETKRTFSVADAKVAKLWGKRGRDGQDTPWITYPDRMMQFRARGFTLRDVGADLLLGLILAEEAQDYPTVEGTIVSSEVVTPQSVSLLEDVPEALRDNIGKAYVELKLSTPNADGSGWTPNGLGLAKLNEFLGGDGVDPEAGAIQLLTWCRDEYAKRRTGAPAKRRSEGNGKTPKPTTTSQNPDTTPDTSDPVVRNVLPTPTEPAQKVDIPAFVSPSTATIDETEALF